MIIIFSLTLECHGDGESSRISHRHLDQAEVQPVSHTGTSSQAGKYLKVCHWYYSAASLLRVSLFREPPLLAVPLCPPLMQWALPNCPSCVVPRSATWSATCFVVIWAALWDKIRHSNDEIHSWCDSFRVLRLLLWQIEVRKPFQSTVRDFLGQVELWISKIAWFLAEKKNIWVFLVHFFVGAKRDTAK